MPNPRKSFATRPASTPILTPQGIRGTPVLHVRDIPLAAEKAVPRLGGGRVIMRHNFNQAAQAAQSFSQTPGLLDPQTRANQIQTRLQAAATAQYNKAATGRFARGIRATVKRFKSSTGEGHAIIVTTFNYRETNFLTNIGGSGYFKEFPVGPYRIFAKGAEGSDTLVNTLTGTVKRRSDREAVRIARGAASSRLKVPKPGIFFRAARKVGRGGGESREIAGFPHDADLGSPLPGGGGAYSLANAGAFFYPLWVNHPGFGRDVVSDVAAQEGALYQEETLGLVVGEISEKSRKALETTQMVVSRVIPLPGSGVGKAGDSDIIAFARGLQRKPLPYVPPPTGGVLIGNRWRSRATGRFLKV